MAYSGGSARQPAYLPVFPVPYIREKFPPCRCLCTWAYSPVTYGTVDRPHVLKVRYALCPVHHRAWTPEQEWGRSNERNAGRTSEAGSGREADSRRSKEGSGRSYDGPERVEEDSGSDQTTRRGRKTRETRKAPKMIAEVPVDKGYL